MRALKGGGLRKKWNRELVISATTCLIRTGEIKMDGEKGRKGGLPLAAPSASARRKRLPCHKRWQRCSAEPEVCPDPPHTSGRADAEALPAIQGETDERILLLETHTPYTCCPVIHQQLTYTYQQVQPCTRTHTAPPAPGRIG